ncbi:hypothetical protein KY359_02995 [Candidatus Woesearchaeota archaeon]|nr:hypothetical protein [Candidatus Woesearchaeota archaeon]
MALYLNSPEWFAGIDSSIEFLSLIVALLVSWYAYKVYRLSGERKYKHFAIAFILAGVAYIFKILSQIIIYEKELVLQRIGPFLVSRTVLEPVTWLHTYSYTIFSLLMLFFMLLLIIVTFRIKDKPTLILLTYFIVVLTLASSRAQGLLHITLALMAALLVFHFYTNYDRHKTRQALFVTLAFLGILFSHIVMIFMVYDPKIYVAGEALQLAGFLSLMYAFILVRKK